MSGTSRRRSSGDEIAMVGTTVPDSPTCSNPDDLFEFPSEAETPAPAADQAAQNPAPAASDHVASRSSAPIPPPTPSTVDALLEFASDNGRPKSRPPRRSSPPRYATPRVDEPGAFDRWRPVVVRWVLPSAAAFAVGAMSMLITLREPAPIPSRVEDVSPKTAPRSTSDLRSTSAAPNRSVPALLFDPSIARGGVDNPIAAREVPEPPQPRVQPADESSAQPAAPAATAVATVAVKQPERSVATRGDIPAPPASSRSGHELTNATRQAMSAAANRPDTLPAVDLSPIAPLSTAARGRDLPDAVVIEPPRPSRPAVEPAAAPSTADQDAVRLALVSYEAAYETLNVAAAAEVWPNVDKQRLARAFAMLKSQGLEFETCAITVRDVNATVYCRGTLEYVRKVGNPTPLTAEQQWTFKMRRAGGAWKIDDVNASQAPVLAAQRTRGQG